MPDDTRSDEALIEDAHRALKRVVEMTRPSPEARVADAAITVLGKRLIQRTEENHVAEEQADTYRREWESACERERAANHLRQDARDALADVRDLAGKIGSDALALDGRIRLELGGP